MECFYRSRQSQEQLQQFWVIRRSQTGLKEMGKRVSISLISEELDKGKSVSSYEQTRRLRLLRQDLGPMWFKSTLVLISIRTTGSQPSTAEKPALSQFGFEPFLISLRTHGLA
jgi:hypothetical protein